MRSLLLLLALAAPSVDASIVLSGFTADLPGGGNDDAFEIWNDGPLPVSLDDVTMTDGEGTLAFHPGSRLEPGARIVVALNASSYTLAARKAPDYESSQLRIDGSLSLRQDGDGLQLLQGGRVVDAVAYGDVGDVEGWKGPPLELNTEDLAWHVRRDLPAEAASWTSPQRPRLGWRLHEVPQFTHELQATAFTAPEQSRAVLLGLLRSAQDSIRLNVYELRDAEVAEILAKHLAQGRGEVYVLVDAQPVGMGAEERLIRDSILHHLEDAGARVRLMQHQRYEFDHAKYVIVDERWSLVQSENFVPSGIPPDAVDGNRGWGVLLDDREIALRLAELFDHDFTLDPFGARELGPEEERTVPLPAVAHATPRPRLAVATADQFQVTILAGPESNLASDDRVLAAIRSTRSEILVEHLQLPPRWIDGAGRDMPNDYLEALKAAATRGVTVKILLDGHFEGREGYSNADTATALAGIPNLEVRLAKGERVLHVKGMVADGRYSVVGSTNWNLNSLAQNRELSVLMDEPAFAALYAEAFRLDWDDAAGEEAADRVPFVDIATVITSAAIVVATLRRRA